MEEEPGDSQKSTMKRDSEDNTYKPAATVSPTIREPSEEKTEIEDKYSKSPLNPNLDKVLTNMRNLVEILSEKEHVPKNVLLVGPPEAGKSALINLLHSSIQGRYEPITEPGSSLSGEVGSLTGHIRFFPNMGLSAKSVREFRKRYSIPEECHLPTIIDMPGVEVDLQVIKYILCGAVPPDTELQSFMTGGKVSPYLDFNNSEARKVDRVIFVASMLKDVQRNIYEKVVTVVRGNKGTLACIPYFLVLTHMDEITEPKSENEQKRISDLIDCLSLRGQAKIRVHELSNYSDADDTDPQRIYAYATNLAKHADGLALLCKVLSRRDVIKPPNVSANPVTDMTAYIDYASRLTDDFIASLRRINWQYILLAAVIIFVAFVSMMLQRMLMNMKV